ncbi:MAG TPA: LPS export ABC transporter permease LptF [Steroidobacteraceae bacterium]|nr:LPS export ABC transporter permease LptF [Steroidobacteraceae bacterium]
MALLGRILERYILREVVTSWLAVTGVLLVILVTNELARVLSRAADNQYPRSMVLELIGLGAVHNLNILVPIGLLLGIVLAFGRLYHDSEMTALIACGAGPSRIYLPVSILALVTTALLAWLSLDVAPDAMLRVLNLRSIALRAGQFAPVAPGRFRTFGGGATVVYAEGETADGTLSNVFVEHGRGPSLSVAIAARARHAISPDGRSLTITLYDGERIEGEPGSPQFRIMYFTEHTVPVQMPPPVIAVSDLDATPTRELVGSPDRAREAELQWRLALPVMGVVLTLVAVPLSRLSPRQGRYARVWLAGIVYLIYSNLIALGRSWIEHGSLPPTFGLWWTHAAVVLAVLLIVGGPRWFARLRHRDVVVAAAAGLTDAT